MNKKRCFQILSEFLEQVEAKYKLRKGDYRLSFYAKPNISVCFTVITLDKVKLKTEADIFLYAKNSKKVSSAFDFKINQFLFLYFEDNLSHYNTLKISQQIKISADALNDVYLDQAVIPIQLL